jgi:hypothetical protein
MAGQDWKRAYESSICLLQSSRCGHSLAVGNVAMKLMDWARASGQLQSSGTVSFAAACSSPRRKTGQSREIGAPPTNDRISVATIGN